MKEKFCLREGKSIPEANLLMEIRMEYWKKRKGDLPEDIEMDLHKCVNLLFPTASRRETKKGKDVYPYQLIYIYSVYMYTCVSY
jgi:hypothetical protein